MCLSFFLAVVVVQLHLFFIVCPLFLHHSGRFSSIWLSLLAFAFVPFVWRLCKMEFVPFKLFQFHSMNARILLYICVFWTSCSIHTQYRDMGPIDYTCHRIDKCLYFPLLFPSCPCVSVCLWIETTAWQKKTWLRISTWQSNFFHISSILDNSLFAESVFLLRIEIASEFSMETSNCNR